jgi:hypothetical protein
MFGKADDQDRTVHNYLSICGPDEFGCNVANATSTHVCWLRKLCGVVHQRWPEGQGIGVIGMCLTGHFPLALMSEPLVVAPVVCQPTTPVNGWTYFGLFTDEQALGLYPKDLQTAKEAAEKRKVQILGLRYRGDWRCRKPRCERLSKEFGQQFFRLDLPGRHHSTLAFDRCGAATEEVLAFLNVRLRSDPDPAIRFPIRSKPGSKEEIMLDRHTCDQNDRA